MRKNIDMLNGPLGPAIIRFAIPVMLTTLIQSLFNTVDLVVIGQFCGSLMVAAVSATASVTSALINLFIGASLGAGLSAAKALGSRQEERVSRVVHTAVSAAIIGGLFLSVVGAVFAPELLKVMDTPEDVLPLSSIYVRIYFTGSLFIVVYNFCAAILRATGDTKTPLYFLIVSGVLKVILNIFFVAACKLDVVGVALSTVLSQGVSATLVIVALIRRNDTCKLSFKKLRIHKKPLLEILQIGLPAGIQSSLFSISHIFTATALNSFDSAAVLSGNGAAQSLEVFTDAIDIGFTQTTSNFVAQNLGARQYDRVKKTFLSCMKFSTVSVLAAGILMNLFDEQLLGLYITDSAEAIGYGATRMRYILIPGFLMTAMSKATGGLQGLGHALSATTITLLTSCALRIAWIYTVFAIPQYHTLDCLYVIYPIGWVITTTIGVIMFFRILKKKSHTALAIDA